MQSIEHTRAKGRRIRSTGRGREIVPPIKLLPNEEDTRGANGKHRCKGRKGKPERRRERDEEPR